MLSSVFEALVGVWGSPPCLSRVWEVTLKSPIMMILSVYGMRDR